MLNKIIKKSAKFFIIFLFIFGISLSNIPFLAVSGLIDSYIKTRGIVDKVWLVKQDGNKDIVDNYTSLRTISEKLRVMEALAAAPTYVNKGTFTSGTAALTVPVPASYQDGDVFLLFVESANQAIATPSGWTQVANSPQYTGTAATAGGVRLAVFYKIVSGAQSSVSVADSGNHTTAIIAGFRGVDNSTPIHITAGSVNASATSNISTPSVTTTVTDTMIVNAIGLDKDLADTDTITSAPSNANLTNLTERHDQTVNSGVGGGLAFFTGEKASAGAVGNTTATADSATTHAYITIALKPAPDTTPPTPNPMTFASVPSNFSASQIDMTATTASDPSTPISYLFTNDNSSCGANAGTGGTSSSWQTGTTYSDTGLQPNKCYGYTIQARDSLSNTGTASGISSTYTSANVPSAPTVGSPTSNSLVITNNENGNPLSNPATLFAVQVTTVDANWNGKWVDSLGNAAVSEQWLTDAQLTSLTVNGLAASTQYDFNAKAKNEDSDQTGLGATGSGTTSAPATNLTVGASGSQTANSDSGAPDVYFEGAFTFSMNSGSDMVTSITVSNNGTAGNLSNVRLYYDNGGGYGGGDDTLFGSGILGSAIVGSMAVTNPTTRSVYVVADIPTSVYGGQTVDLRLTATAVSGGSTINGLPADITASTTIRPNVTSYDNTTESALNNLGARNGQNITINGAGFGTSCASISAQIEGTTITCNSANNTTISATIPSAQTTTYGGTAASGKGLLVTVGGAQDDARQDFYVYPNVTIPPTNDSGREASDIIIQGTRFGSTQGAVDFVGGFGTVSANITIWGDTSVTVTVPTAISDSVYLGDIRLTRASDTGSKTDLVYDANGFRVLPRVTGLVPNSGPNGTPTTISGDHLCQQTTCKTAAEYNATANDGDDVKWGTTNATVTGTPSHTSFTVNAPSLSDGVYSVTITSLNYASNGQDFTVSNAITTISDFVSGEPSSVIIAPGASAQADSFGLQTNTGGDTVTAATVTLAAGTGAYIQTVAITNDGDTITYCSAAPSGDTASLSSCGITVSTTNTQFKIKITAISHTSMPAPDGGSYAATARITAFTSTNSQLGSDSGSATITIDNDSPNGTTGANATSGENGQSVVSWINPGDGDFQQVYIYCKTASITEAPTEGTDPSVDAAACDGTVRLKYKGTISPQTITGLTNDITYYFRIYARDTNGNFTAYANTQQVSATPTAPPEIIVSSTGTQSNLDAGATSQYVGAAFTIRKSSGIAENLTAITISDVGGSVNANTDLSNAKLRYEQPGSAVCTYDGTESITGAVSFNASDQAVFSGLSIPITVHGANVTCLYLVFDVKNGANYPVGGQTFEPQVTSTGDFTTSGGTTKAGTYPVTLSGSTTIRPDTTSYDNTTESALNNLGARNGQNITINGAGFGTSCASISVQVEGTTITCNSANNTTISATIPSAQTTTYGGTAASGKGLLVTVGGAQDDARQDFYVYPNVTIPPTNDSGREASDIIIQGTRFGTTQGAVDFVGGFGTVSANITGWGDTSVTVTVPTAISDSVYLGDIRLTRASDTGSKTDLVYDANGFRVLPRIISLTPNSGVTGTDVAIAGDHLCSGTCPSLLSDWNDVVDDGYDVKWNTTNVTILSPTPTHTLITIDTPNITEGPYTVTVVSGGITSYTSNGLSYTINTSKPDTPTNNYQFKNNTDTAQPPTTNVAVGGGINQNNVWFRMDMFGPLTGENYFPQIEIKPVTMAFECTNASPTPCSVASGVFAEGAGVTYNGTVVQGFVQATDLTHGTSYHWQARVRNSAGTSNWVSFGGNSDPSDVDFYIDTVGPNITNLCAVSPTATYCDNSAPSDIQAQIRWNTDESSDYQIAYGGANLSCPGGADSAAVFDALALQSGGGKVPASPSGSGTSHSVSLTGLTADKIYKYMVRSADTFGNVSYYPNTTTCDISFQTATPKNRLMKTLEFYIQQATNTTGEAFPVDFLPYISEKSATTDIIIKSAIIEVFGISSGGSGNISVVLNFSGGLEPNGSTTYTLSDPGTYATPWSVVKEATSLSYNCPGCSPASTNTLNVTVNNAASTSLVGAKLIITYYYEFQ